MYLVAYHYVFHSPEGALAAMTLFVIVSQLKINVTNALGAETLNRKEAYLLALSVAANEKVTALQEAFTAQAIANGATDKEVAEVLACTSLLNANNVVYIVVLLWWILCLWQDEPKAAKAAPELKSAPEAAPPAEQA